MEEEQVAKEEEVEKKEREERQGQMEAGWASPSTSSTYRRPTQVLGEQLSASTHHYSMQTENVQCT